MGLNARIKNGDTIYIPESGDEMVYVMGAVQKPGALILKDRLSFLDAVMMSGGPTRGLDNHKTFLVRQKEEGQIVIEINLKEMIETGDQRTNYILKDNDIVFVAQSGVEKINTLLNDTLPFLQVMSLGTGVANSLGITKPANLE
jgi:polysaccharide export outer membrane protein